MYSKVPILGTPDNLILGESSFNSRSFAFYLEKTSTMKQPNFRDVFKKASKSVCDIS
jgi:hypothetical protein